MTVKIKSPSLNVTLAGIEFRSPIGVAVYGALFGKHNKVTPKVRAEILLKHATAGAGFLYIPPLSFLTKATLAKLEERARPGKRPARLPPNRTMDIKVGDVPGTYRMNTPFWHDPDIEQMRERSRFTEEVTKILQDKKPKDVWLISEVSGFGDLPDTYADSAKKCEQLGADLIQLNLSCPQPPTVRGAVEDFLEKRYLARFQGMLMGDDAEHVEEITRAVVKAVKIPVGVKLSPETGFPRVIGIAKRARDAGAKWIEGVNQGIAILPPDIYHRGKTLWPFADANPFCCINGSWLRPICYKQVAAIAKFVPGIDIAAAGGLMTPEHCVEVMMLGARLAQPCAAVIEKGNNFIRQCNTFLRKFMVEQGYQSVEEFIGIAQQHIKYNEEIHFMDTVAELDESKCTLCGVCADGLCIALSLDSGTIKLDTEKCSGCGSCSIVCTAGALKARR